MPAEHERHVVVKLVALLFEDQWLPIVAADARVVVEIDDRQAFEAYTKSPERTTATQDRMNYGDKRGAEIRWLAYYEAIKTWQK